MKPAVDPPDLLAMTCQRVEVGALSSLPARIVTHSGRKVLNLAQLLVRQRQAFYQGLKVQPEVLPAFSWGELWYGVDIPGRGE